MLLKSDGKTGKRLLTVKQKREIVMHNEDPVLWTYTKGEGLTGVKNTDKSCRSIYTSKINALMRN